MSNANDSETVKFFNRVYNDLYLNDEVLHHSKKDRSNKYNNVKEYLSMLEGLHDKNKLSKERIKFFKKFCHEKYVIKPEEIPPGYFEALEVEKPQDVKVNDIHRREIIDEVIESQEKSLDAWIDFFLNDDTRIYPYWVKYWAFNGVLKLGNFDIVEGSYNIRNKNTVSPFVYLDREALSLTIDMVLRELNKKTIDDKDLEKMIKDESFPRIYTYILNEELVYNEDNIPRRDEGRWVKFDRGSDYNKLTKSLEGFNTGWAITGKTIAEAVLSNCSVYIYFTLDVEGEYRIPRIAIRTEGNKIAEIRGIDYCQNLEPSLENIVAQKIQEFPDKEEYYERIRDMQRLTDIYDKHNRKEELGLDELFFLYEIKGKIVGFGYDEDPRIEEIKSERSVRKDIALIFGCSYEQVATTKEDINSLTGVYFGNLKVTKKDRIMGLPTIVWGNLDLSEFEDQPNIGFSEIVKGDLLLDGLSELDGLLFPRIVHGDLSISEVTKAKNLTFPDVGGSVYMGFLLKGENLYFNEYTGSINMQNLLDARSIQFPRSVKGYLLLNHFQKYDSVKFPDSVHSLIIGSPDKGKLLKFPKEVKVHFIVDSISNIEEVVLPESVGKWVSIHKVVNCKNINFSRTTGNIVINDETISDIKAFKEKYGIKQD